ncbi:hypothetical protein BH11ACT4_BH11ACT4_13180 [soil metagenome]
MLKDENLASLAKDHNVAEFASFGPEGKLRHSSFRVAPGGALSRIGLAAEQLLSRGRPVNLRTFTIDGRQSTPFVYGIESASEVVSAAHALLADDYYLIINEQIDIHDGGVSGVAQQGLVEFAPDATPRVVEDPNRSVAQLPTAVAESVLGTVYGIDLSFPPADRLEFSIHPLRVGSRSERTIVWESSKAPSNPLGAEISWPNDFSRLIGDKTYGLVVANALGLPVPRTLVVARRVAPFRFGVSTGSQETWMRTSPTEPRPGLFTTTRGWQDPFTLLEMEDPEREIGSVLAQDGVIAEFSGSAATATGGGYVIEGQAGYGDNFMLGGSPSPLPSEVVSSVKDLLDKIRAVLGEVQIEWAIDGRRVWLLQVHVRSLKGIGGQTLSPGRTERWLDYDPEAGLAALRALTKQARAEAAGIYVVRPVGITSHVGDVIRAAGVPGRMARP